jgi:hypothetical protein
MTLRIERLIRGEECHRVACEWTDAYRMCDRDLQSFCRSQELRGLNLSKKSLASRLRVVRLTLRTL